MVQPFERLLDGTATDVALEEDPDLLSGEAAFRGLKGFVDAIGDGVSDVCGAGVAGAATSSVLLRTGSLRVEK
jgi:hypothetical protein